MWLLWLVFASIFFVAEIFTTGFLIFWFGVGAICAMLVSIFYTNIFIQTAVFIVVSTLCLIFTKPLIKKILPEKEIIPTNVYTILNKEGIVIEDINNIDYSGKVKVNGELWSAISEEPLKKGSKIEVIQVDGVKLRVKQKIQTSTSQN